MCPWLTQMHKRKCFISQEEPSVPANTSLHRALHPGDLMALKIEAAVWLIIYWPTVCVTSGTELWSAQAIFVDTRYWILHLGKASRKIFGHSPLYVYLSSCEWKERKREERGEKLKKVHFIVFIHHKQNIFSSLAKPSWLIQHCLEKKKKKKSILNPNCKVKRAWTYKRLGLRDKAVEDWARRWIYSAVKL